MEETIEDFIKRESKSANESVGIVKGAKWMQERMYSEEEYKKESNVDNDFIVWDELFGILAWEFKPTRSGDMFLDASKVYEVLKNKFELKRK
jgi:hypothetical protein